MSREIKLETRGLLGFKLESREKLQQLSKSGSDHIQSHIRSLSSKIGGKGGLKNIRW